jgi:hypothetical protein
MWQVGKHNKQSKQIIILNIFLALKNINFLVFFPSGSGDGSLVLML